MKIGMPSMQDMRSGFVNAAGSVKGSFVTTNKENGKAQWNGRNIALASIATGTALTGVAMALRYGTDFAAISAGVQLDATAARAALSKGATTVVDYADAGQKNVRAAFEKTFSTANANALAAGINAIPGQVAKGFEDLGAVITTGFEKASKQVGEIATTVTQTAADVATVLSDLKEIRKHLGISA